MELKSENNEKKAMNGTASFASFPQIEVTTLGSKFYMTADGHFTAFAPIFYAHIWPQLIRVGIYVAHSESISTLYVPRGPVPAQFAFGHKPQS